MASKTRLSDLAKQAGVSTATVSRVLNGKSSVAPETRQAVLEALDLLGYERPEKLRERTGGLIGMIVPELSNPIFPMFAQHLSTAMYLRGYTPILGTQAAGGVTEDSYISAMLSHHVSGMIFVSGLHADSTADTTRYDDISARGVPFVTINGANPAIAAPDFSTDDESAIHQAVRHLTGLGHTRIGFASGPTRFIPTQNKLDAFVKYMGELAPNAEHRTAHTLFTIEGGMAAAKQLVDAGVTAIVCASDIMAPGVLRYCQTAGMEVPRDLSVVGFDDSWMMTQVHPPLTTLRQPVGAICDAAVSTLISKIDGTPTKMDALRFAPELVVRETTAPPVAS